jgi:uncharacterized membrane protein
MSKGRLEAFSDAVLAIVLTIMVLELEVPHDASLAGLRPLVPQLLAYALSFVFLGIYWNNHHHLLQAARRVSGGVLWTNMHLLFWLSLVPFVTAWLGRNPLASGPVAAYGAVMVLAACAYTLLVRALLRVHGPDSPLASAIGSDLKGKMSLALYVAALALAFVLPAAAIAVYVVVALIWIVPDRRIERALGQAAVGDQPGSD